MKLSTGFNLVELMTTLVIAITLVSIALPSLTDLYQAYRANMAIRTIQSTLMLGRNAAISYGARVTACPLTDGNCHNDWQQGITLFIDLGEPNVIDGQDQILLTSDSFHEHDFIKYNRAAIRFQRDGMASGTNGTLSYCPSSRTSPFSQAVVINQAGRIRFSTKNNITCID
ncbi:general secretion pathway protein GspH [Shewanella sp. Scap07]|uniref:GspH/FimT family pseudopilin n=1 Tax=Shewanella sp. Scap07 TaxID=2589987 RepID=UPI0015C0EE28|nr:GspH/FimT family pseudopilin [Shewanella sp. Scap07]QLE84656.1 general secretion pathway protein GspH [Shewanella sp. Scap07]